MEIFAKLEQAGEIDVSALVTALYKKAIGGDTGAVKEFLERRFGKVRYEFAVEGQLGTVVQELEKVSPSELRAFAEGGAMPAALVPVFEAASRDEREGKGGGDGH